MIRFLRHDITKLLLLAALTGVLPAAPSSGVIVGLIVSPSGTPVSRLQVELIDTASGAHFEATTDDQGFFAFSLLPSGTYRLEPAKGRFLPAGGDRMVLDPGEKRSWRLLWDNGAGR